MYKLLLGFIFFLELVTINCKTAYLIRDNETLINTKPLREDKKIASLGYQLYRQNMVAALLIPTRFALFYLDKMGFLNETVIKEPKTIWNNSIEYQYTAYE